VGGTRDDVPPHRFRTNVADRPAGGGNGAPRCGGGAHR
jgi:hypothetical protein